MTFTRRSSGNSRSRSGGMITSKKLSLSYFSVVTSNSSVKIFLVSSIIPEVSSLALAKLSDLDSCDLFPVDIFLSNSSTFTCKLPTVSASAVRSSFSETSLGASLFTSFFSTGGFTSFSFGLVFVLVFGVGVITCSIN